MSSRPSLLTGQDGYIEDLRFDEAKGDTLTNSVIVPGTLRTPLARMKGVGDVLVESDWSKEILSIVEWSTRSVAARLGMEVREIFPTEAILSDDEWLVDANFAFRPWENIDGKPVENPLLNYLRKHFSEMLIEAGRPFIILPGAEALSEDEIMEAQLKHRLRVHAKAKLIHGGVVLPSTDLHFRLRGDMVNEDQLQKILRGAGRGALDAMQPAITNWDRKVEPGSYVITATNCSIAEGLTGVLSREMYDLDGNVSFMRHGESRVWDGWKTMGPHPRHLEGMFPKLMTAQTDTRELDVKTQAAHLKVYTSAGENGSGNGALKRVVPAYSDVHTAGVHLDHFASAETDQQKIRDVLTRLEEREDIWGFFVSAGGVTPVPSEAFSVEQNMAVMHFAQQSTHKGRQAFDQWPELAELSELLPHMGDPRQRAVLFCKETPEAPAMYDMMRHGVRGMFTPNISRSGKQNVYLSAKQLSEYKTLAQQGMDLYLVTPSCIRRQWNDLFVRLDAMERVQKADFRIGGFASSANGAEEVMKKGHLEEFLQLCLKDYPNAALVTGAAQAGGMLYLNEAAKAAGMTTIGIANFIPNQEEPGDNLDALVCFSRYDFDERQKLMSAMLSLPVVSIGAQGTAYEALKEMVHRKIALGSMSPVMFVDPEGLDKGRNMWWPIQRLESTFATPITGKDRETFTLSRSPYMTKLNIQTDSYVKGYQRSKKYFSNPVKFLRNAGASEDAIANAIASIEYDAALDGLPIHAYWKESIEQWHAGKKNS